jgi:hypothetical protein
MVSVNLSSCFFSESFSLKPTIWFVLELCREEEEEEEEKEEEEKENIQQKTMNVQSCMHTVVFTSL